MFYPGDWRKDPAVQSLDFEHRGIWLEVLLLMHEAPERGRLVLPGGAPMQDEGIARNLGLPLAKWKRARQRLLDYGVASEDEAGVLCNRRMVRDEEVRQKRIAGGRLGGNPALMVGRKDTGEVGAKDNLGDNLGDNLQANLAPTPSSSSSSSPASSRKKEGAAGWAHHACELWEQAMGGTPPGGRIGKALKPLVAKHGEAEVLARWEAYLGSDDDPRFKSPQDFASKYGALAGATAGRSDELTGKDLEVLAQIEAERKARGEDVPGPTDGHGARAGTPPEPAGAPADGPFRCAAGCGRAVGAPRVVCIGCSNRGAV